MKKSAAKICIAFTLVLALALVSGVISMPSDITEAAEVRYATASPQNLKDNDFAGQSTIPVKDGDTEEILFYLIESYYYPVTKVASFYTLEIGDNYYIEGSALSNTPVSYENVTTANALPTLNLQTKEIVSVDGVDVNTAEGWTVKLIGLNGDNLFVNAMKDDVSVFGSAEKSLFNDFDIAYHPIAQAEREGLISQTPDENNALGTTNNGNQSKTLRIILIIGIIIPAVIIVLLLFKPSKKGGYDKRPARERKSTERVDYDRDRRYYQDRRYEQDPRYGDDRYYDGYSPRKHYDDNGHDPYRDDRR